MAAISATMICAGRADFQEATRTLAPLALQNRIVRFSNSGCIFFNILYYVHSNTNIILLNGDENRFFRKLSSNFGRFDSDLDLQYTEITTKFRKN